MARDLLASASRASAALSGIMPPWLTAIFSVAASICIVTLAVFLCGRSSHSVDHDGIPKKKPAAAKAAKPVAAKAAKPAAAKAVKPAKASRAASFGTTDVSGAAYLAGVTAGLGSSGCGGGGGGGGGCGGGGGGGGGCGGGGGGGGC
ncbi:uncharacterized protein [Lolium perenne]|uniref:uncharacterized protein n=1 Tax=Lolium perenne TaxID=4522 RepID=UPI0021EA18D2|nr:uncharacterized protein LOC127349212 [Lolium perenne]